MAQVNIRMDDSMKVCADALFAELGLNMTTAITLFIRQSLRRGGIPFMVGTRGEPASVLAADNAIQEKSASVARKKTPKFGCGKGKIRMADDFDAPLEDFGEYMQ
jgi:DNA-damage-inducible protein J